MKKFWKKNKSTLIGILAAVIFCLVCYFTIFREDTTSDATSSTTTTTASADSVDYEVDPDSLSGTYYAEMVIEDYGTVTIALDADTAPITVANFIELSLEGFYDGLTFHRYVENFCLQGGDPDADGTGGSDETITGEFSSNGVDNDISHTTGVISMARSSTGYDTASSQFFFTLSDDYTSSLDGLYAAFGYVTEGWDIIEELCEYLSENAEYSDSSSGTLASTSQPVITSVTIYNEDGTLFTVGDETSIDEETTESETAETTTAEDATEAETSTDEE